MSALADMLLCVIVFINGRGRRDIGENFVIVIIKRNEEHAL